MGQTTTVSTSRKVQGMDQKTEILFLTLKTTEMKSVRPNDLSLMRNLQRQGLLVEKRIANDIKELHEIALTFMSSSQTSPFVVFSSDDELYEVARSNLTIEQKKSILPVRKETAFKVLGSKVGFIEFCRENSIPHPQTQVIKFKDQLSNLERFLVGEQRQPGNNPVHVQANKMADVIIENGLSKMDEVWAMEQSLYFPGLYSGTTDLVGVYQGQPAICDHKQTNKPKKAEWVEDYYIQLVAYILAHNEVYKTDMKRGVIFMCSRDFQYQQFDLTPDNFNKYQDLWLTKVEEYYSLSR